MSTATDMHNAFVRAMEAEYEQRVASNLAGGLALEDAHVQAFEDVKLFGRAVLQDLSRRGLFPWPEEVDPPRRDGTSAD